VSSQARHHPRRRSIAVALYHSVVQLGRKENGHFVDIKEEDDFAYGWPCLRVWHNACSCAHCENDTFLFWSSGVSVCGGYRPVARFAWGSPQHRT
jgi:hypothetical protein